jgi:hypothetical protein
MLGLSGSPALTVAWTMQQSDPDSFPFWLGTTGTGACFNCNFYTVGRVNNGSGGYREFTYASAISSPARWIAGKAASATPSAHTLEQNGSALSQSGLAGGAIAMNLSGGGWRIGSDIADGECCAMVCNSMVVFSAVLTGADKTALDSLLSLHV